MTVDIPTSKRARLREDFVPSCVEEMQQWVWDRQQDLQAATMAGRPEEVGRISQLIIQGAQECTEFKPNKPRSGPRVSWFDDRTAVEMPHCRSTSWTFVRGGTHCTGSGVSVSGRRRTRVQGVADG